MKRTQKPPYTGGFSYASQVENQFLGKRVSIEAIDIFPFVLHPFYMKLVYRHWNIDSCDN